MNKLFVKLISAFILKKKNRKKFRQKHLRNNVVKTNEETNYIKECYWANVFRDTIQNSDWLLNKSFSPGRWALNYIALYVLYRVLNDINPSSILECGLGQSSRMTIQYANFYNKNLIIFENNIDWLNFFSIDFPIATKYTKIYDLDYITIYNNEKSRVYRGFENDIKNKIFNLIIIDGPLGSPRFSRAQLLNFLDYIDPNNFIILMDDYNRIGEQDTIQKCKDILDLRNIKYTFGVYSSDKSIAVLCSINHKFLLTL